MKIGQDQPGPAAGVARAIGGPLNRRSFLAAGGAFAAGAFLSACAGGNTKTGQAAGKTSSASGASLSGKKLTITVTPFAGADLAKMPKAFAEEYQAKHPNVTINFDDTVLFTKQVAGFKADPNQALTNLAFSNSGSTATGKALGMYKKLDYSKIPNTSHLAPNLVEKDHCGVVFGADQMGIVSNKDAYPHGLKSWTDLWSDSQKGKECFFTIPWWAIGIAAKQDGGSWNDMDPGFKIWADHASNIRTIVTANPQFLNVLASGEAPLTSHYFGTSHVWASQGAPLQYSTPKEGVVFDAVGVNVVAASSDDQIEVMYDMINEMLTPRWNGMWADTAVEVPALTTTKLTDKLKKLPQISAGAKQDFVKVDWDAVGQNLPAWTAQWNKDVVSKI
jgi:putative spermidine/putrescine transport system substrate-binding protein